MKLTLTILFALIVGVAAGQSKTESLPVTKSMGYSTFKIGSKVAIDSVGENDEVFIWNYKKIPAKGLYSYERYSKDKYSTSIESVVILDRKFIYKLCVVQPLTHYGDKRIWYFGTNKK